MALPFPINASQTDAKSPVDDNLMDSIRQNLNYLDAAITGGSFAFQWNVNGPLNRLASWKKPLDTGVSFAEVTPNTCRAILKNSGTSGTLEFDIRKITTPKTAIIGIDHQYEGNTQSIGRVGSALSTQSIARSTSQIATQSITYAKNTLNTESIINVGTNLWRFNFAAGTILDSDWALEKYIKTESHTAGANNGTFAIMEVNSGNFPSIVVSNASGVAQTAAAGTVKLQLFSYNYSNPVDPDFFVGENVLFATHTTPANNGSFEIHKVNELGNNILVYNQTGVEQAGVAGTADANRWIFTYSSAVSAADYIPGEKALMASHSNALNNGNLLIIELNRGGNNLIIYNSAGVAQPAAAGNANTNRWTYALNTDPSAQISVGQSISAESHTTSANNAIFVVKEVNRSASNNIVIYNESGVTQAGIVGVIRHTRKLVKFSSDQSAVYEVGSYIEIWGTSSADYHCLDGVEQFEVLEVNRGGGSAYNVVIDGQDNVSQPSPAGYIKTEARSLFTVRPSIEVDLTGNEPNNILTIQSTNFVPGTIAANTPLMLYVTSVPEGQPMDLTVTIT